MSSKYEEKKSLPDYFHSQSSVDGVLIMSTLSLSFQPTSLERVCMATVRNLLVICLKKKEKNPQRWQRETLLEVSVGKPSFLTEMPKKVVGGIKCESPAPLFEFLSSLPLRN